MRFNYFDFLESRSALYAKEEDITMTNYLISDGTPSPQKRVQNDSVDSGFQV